MISCDDPLNYTYTLLQRDYCGSQLNSTILTLTTSDYTVTDDTIYISIDIQSLINNSTLSIAVQVTNSFGSTDISLYTNLTSKQCTIHCCYI